MKFLIFSENSRKNYQHYYYRNLGANELRRRIVAAGHQAIIIEWIRQWKKEDLIKIVDKYFIDTEEPVIAVSSVFDLGNHDLQYLSDILIYAKNKHPNLKVIHGGNRVFFEGEKYYELVDVDFLGRSMGIFDDWIRNKDVSQYTVHDNNPLVLTNHNVDKSIDIPIIHELTDDDCLNKNDILGFEIGIGCKFNCAFCNYELRNAKTVYLNDPKKLHDFLEKAHKKYGITNFYSIDDTINESEEKLEIIAEAVSNLNFKPYITSWARLDLLHKPKQRELFKKINFSAIWFGIESFNPEVSKIIRKKSGMDHVYSSLEFMRDECPDTFTMGSFIVGLNKDSLSSIETGLDKAANEKLLNAIQLFAFTINRAEFKDNYLQSDLEKNPEKFGYKIYPNISGSSNDNKIVTTQLIWESDWTNNIEAHKMVDALIKKYNKNFLILSHSECSSFRAMGLIEKNKIYNLDTVKSKAINLVTMYKQSYIQQKKRLLGI